MSGKLFDFNVDSQDHSFLASLEDEDRVNKNDPCRRHVKFQEDPVLGFYDSPEDEFIAREGVEEDSLFEDGAEIMDAESAVLDDAAAADTFSEAEYFQMWMTTDQGIDAEDAEEIEADSFDKVEKGILHRESHGNQRGSKFCARASSIFDEYSKKFGKRLTRSCKRYMSTQKKAVESRVRKARKQALHEKFLYA
jgi:hypothetical protein